MSKKEHAPLTIAGKETINLTPELVEYYKQNIPELLLDIDRIIPVTVEDVGFAGYQFAHRKASAARLGMAGGLLSKFVPLINGEERHIQSGVDTRLAMTSMEVKIEEDSVVRAHITSNTTGSVVLFLENKDRVVSELEVPKFAFYEKGFGYSYQHTDALQQCINGGVTVKAGTVIAKTQSVKDNYGLGVSVNANVAFLTEPFNDQDAMTISDRLAKLLSRSFFVEYELNIDPDSVMLNLFGDGVTYKAFPNKGEVVGDVIMAVRSGSQSAALSDRMLRTYDASLDTVIFNKYGRGVVESIEVHRSRKVKPIVPAACEQLNSYVNKMVGFYSKYVSAVDNLRDIKRWGGIISNRYSNYKLLSSPDADTCIKNIKIKGYHIKIIVKHTGPVTLAEKLTTDDGGKGVCGEIRPLEDMPLDNEGNYADVIIHKVSTWNRMIMSRGPESLIAGMIRRCGVEIKREMISKDHDYYDLTPEQIDYYFSMITRLTKVIGNEQHDAYMKFDTDQKLRKLMTIGPLSVSDRTQLTLFIPATNPKAIDQVLLDADKQGLLPIREPISVVKVVNGEKTRVITHEPVRISSMPIYLIDKLSFDGIGNSVVARNPLGRPISSKGVNKHKHPWGGSVVKAVAELDNIILLTAIGGKYTTELIDRSNSLTTNRELVSRLLRVDPITKTRLIDRTKFRYDESSVLKADNAIYRTTGVKMVFKATPIDKERRRVNDIHARGLKDYVSRRVRERYTEGK